MRVLIYHTGMEWTGGARVAGAVGRLLASRGAKVTTAVRPESAVEERFATEGLDVVPLPADPSVVDQSRRLRRIIKDYFIEVVIVTGSRAHLAAAWGMRLAGRGAVLRRVGAGDAIRLTTADGQAGRLTPSGWIFASEAERRAANVPARGIPATVVPLGIEMAMHDTVRPLSRAALNLAGSGPTIVCVGDERVRGRASTVLRALHLLLPRHPELRLVLVGRCTDDEDLQMHAASLGITRQVRFLGERRDQLAILRTADLGWVLADGDDAAYACLDLMALRVPVLAPSGTLAEQYVADGITGRLLVPDDGPGAAAAVAALLARDDQRKTMGEAARARVARDHTEAMMADAAVAAVELARDRTRWTR